MKIGKKQLTLLILTLLSLGFLVWQIFHLIGSRLLVQDRAAYAVAQASTPIKPEEAAANSQTNLEPDDSPYIKLANQYQLLQMQHKLLAEELAIAKLRSQIDALNKKDIALTHDLQPPIQMEAENSIPQYELVYLAQEKNQWTATLLQNHQYQTIHTGDQLKDGTHIVGISQKGVLLKKKNKEMLLSFNDAMPPVHVVQKTPEKTPTETITAAANTASQKTTLQKTALQKTAPQKPTPVLADKDVLPHKTYTLDEILLLELPPNNYTIQLANDPNLSDLKKLIHHFHLSPRAMLFHFEKNKKIQHVLLLGSYRSKAGALSALTRLPTELKLLTPQIVSMHEVQKLMKDIP